MRTLLTVERFSKSKLFVRYTKKQIRFKQFRRKAKKATSKIGYISEEIDIPYEISKEKVTTDGT